MPNGAASEDQLFLIDIYVFKYWQVLQPVQMSAGAVFDQDGHCTGFSWAVLGSRHGSVLKLPAGGVSHLLSTDTGLTLLLFKEEKQNNKNHPHITVFYIGSVCRVGWCTAVLHCLQCCDKWKILFFLVKVKSYFKTVFFLYLWMRRVWIPFRCFDHLQRAHYKENII